MLCNHSEYNPCQVSGAQAVSLRLQGMHDHLPYMREIRLFLPD